MNLPLQFFCMNLPVESKLTLVTNSELLSTEDWLKPRFGFFFHYSTLEVQTCVMNMGREGIKKMREKVKDWERAWKPCQCETALCFYKKYTRKHYSSKKCSHCVKYWTRKRHSQPSLCMWRVMQRVIFHLMRSRNSGSLQAHTAMCMLSVCCKRMCCKAAEERVWTSATWCFLLCALLMDFFFFFTHSLTLDDRMDGSALINTLQIHIRCDNYQLYVNMHVCV